MKRVSLLVASSLMAFAQTAPAAAQSTEEAADEAARSGLEEIVVTAQRRSESAQDVPIAVTAFNADQLSALGVAQAADLTTVIPGLTMNPNAGRSYIYVRGVGNNGYSTSPSVLSFVDGVYQPFDNSAGANYTNIESLELAKGPQGTLFGRNATGGVMQITTRNPMDWQGVDVSAGYANFDTTTANIYAAGALSDAAAIDIAAFYADRGDGWGRNLGTGEDWGVEDRWGARSKFVAELTDTFTVTVAADYSERYGQIGTGFSPALGFSTVFDSGTGTNVPLGFYDVNADESPYFESEEGGASVTLDWDLGGVALQSITAYRVVDEFFHIDSDAGVTTGFHLDRADVRHMTTQEIQASGGREGLNWVAGFYYFWLRDKAIGSDFTGFIAEGVFGALPGTPFSIRAWDTVEAVAAYAQTTFEVLPDTNLTLGARYTIEDRELTGFTTGGVLPSVFGFGPVLSPGSAGTQSASFEEPNYRVALDHHFTPDILGYISWSRGFNAGFFNNQATAGFNNAVNPRVEPEFIDAYEIGVKSDFLDRRLRVNVAVFDYDYSNLQQQIYLNGQISSINAAAAKIQGADFEIVTRPVPDLTLSLGGTYLDATYDSYPLAPNYDFAPNGSLNGVGALDAQGNEVVYAPEWSLQASLMHTLSTSVGSFDTTVHVSYVSDMWGDPQNELEIPNRTLLGFDERWTSSDGLTNITLWAKNVTDEEWETTLAVVTPNGALGQQGAPRTYGVTIGRRF